MGHRAGTVSLFSGEVFFLVRRKEVMNKAFVLSLEDWFRVFDYKEEGW